MNLKIKRLCDFSLKFLKNYCLKLSEIVKVLKNGIETLYKKTAVRMSVNIFLTVIIIVVLLIIILPNPVFKDPYCKIIFSRDNNLIGAKIADDFQWRFPPAKKIPVKYKKALLTYEDKRFYFHPGVDPLAVIRSTYLNLKNGRVISGASTISMQVMRMSCRNNNRTILQKVKETLLTVGLELRYSKKEILLLYSNHAPFGGNVVGLSAASYRYFGRSSDNLSWAESALLAILPNSPSLIHPGKNRQILKQKRNSLLKDLFKNGTINDIDLKLALNEPLPDSPQPFPKMASHALETLVQNNPGENIFQSTLYRTNQKKCNEAVAKFHKILMKRGIYNICVIVIDNGSSEIQAYVGNSGDRNDLSENDLFEDKGYDVDVIRRPRSTGSILKPVLYAAMLKDGEIFPDVLVNDIPSQYNGYVPENFDRSFNGVVPAKVALARSLNVPAVAMLKDYSYSRFYNLLKGLGMTTLFRNADDYGLTLILGGAEGNLWDISNIYSGLARKSMGFDFQKISLLKTPKKEIVNTGNLSPGPAYLTLEALVEVKRPGLDGYWKSFVQSQKIAWKTGTSLGQRDAWAIGVTKKYTVGVWVGNSNGEGVSGMTGLSCAAPVLFDIFNSLEKSAWFDIPYYDLKQIAVCKNSGFLPNEYCDTKYIWVPQNSYFDKVCKYHKLIHLDESQMYRVNSECMSVEKMTHKVWFVLPSVQEYFYKKSDPEYKVLPEYLGKCEKAFEEYSNSIMNIIYPSNNAKVYIPVDVSGEKTAIIIQATHRDESAIIYWHIDDDYIGSTVKFHEKIYTPEPGEHTITLVDKQGNIFERKFFVLSK